MNLFSKRSTLKELRREANKIPDQGSSVLAWFIVAIVAVFILLLLIGQLL